MQHARVVVALLLALIAPLRTSAAYSDLYAAFGLANVAAPCTDGGSAELPLQGPAYVGLCTAKLIDQYAFFDEVHPTAAMHAIIGDDLYAAVIPLPAALPLLGSTLALLGIAGRRRNRRVATGPDGLRQAGLNHSRHRSS